MQHGVRSRWFVIPSNHKWFRNTAVSRIIVETLENFAMKLSVTDDPFVSAPRPKG